MNVRVEGLRKNFLHKSGEIEVLSGLDLSLATGRSAALVGASGAGKSTLLHIIGTLERPSSGTVWYDAVDVFRHNGVELARFRNEYVGFVFQAFHLLPEFTAVENVMMPALIHGLSREKAREQAGEVLTRVGLGERLLHRPGELSGGEQQRVAIARAVMLCPRVLLADEPTGNLDQRTGGEVFDLLHGLQRERGMTMLLATHNPRLAEQVDEVYRLEGGTLHRI
ncbi:MAG: ABC transporter ATP-binding protein [Nitrospirae bacterium]|nr:ABC transporter ATP-binding protein [Nitrospirota bacterium]